MNKVFLSLLLPVYQSLPNAVIQCMLCDYLHAKSLTVNEVG